MKTKLLPLLGAAGVLALLHPGVPAGANQEGRDHGDRGELCLAAEDLGPVFYDGGPSLQSLGLSEEGTVVGATFRWGDRQAFKYEHGVMSPLGDLGGGLSDARVMNRRGYVVGGSRDAQGNYRAAAFHRGKVTDLGAMPGETQPWSWSADVNDAGLAVGNVTVAGRYHAAAFRHGKAFDLGTLGWDTFATGVNDHGDIVGNGQLWEAGPWQAFIFHHGEMRELPELNEANKINSGGTICGAASGPDGYHATLYHHGHLTDLGDLGSPVPWGYSSCYGISETGMAVGIATDASWNSIAFLWRNAREGLIDLNRWIPPEMTVWLFLATGINSEGQIAAYGFNWITLQYVGVRLSPVHCAGR